MNQQQLLALPNDTTTFFESLDSLSATLPGTLSDISSAFRYNLQSVSRMVTVPYRVARRALAPDAEEAARERIHTLPGVEQEAIRRRFRETWQSATADGSLLTRLQAKSDAFDQLNRELREEILPGFQEKTQNRALMTLEDEDTHLGVRELFRQALVLTWGAFEVVSRDGFVRLFNIRPELTTSLFKDKTARRVFKDFKLDIETLASHSFDLSKNMGDLLADGRALDKLATIKVVFKALSPNDTSLSAALDDRQLWTVCQRRHLIVHRRGIVDQQYLTATGDDRSVGESLDIVLNDIQDAMKVTIHAGTEILRVVGNELHRDRNDR